MTPEDQLCLLLVRGRFPPDAQQQASHLLAMALDWSQILERVRIHEVLPLVYRNLQTVGFPGVPEPVRASLEDTFQANALRNTLFAEELKRILPPLRDAGVPVIPLKGAYLAESLYGDLALRVCADIDILVPPQHVAKAFRVLQSSGYEAGFSTPALVDLLGRYGKDCGLMRQGRACAYPLQLHCGLVWGGPLERAMLDEIWSQARHANIHGVPAFALSADWEFLYFAVHAARHGLSPLKWLADLDLMCSRGLVDWPSVSERARRLGWNDPVASSLSACASLFDTPIDPVFTVTKSRIPLSLDAPHSSALQIPREVLFAALLPRSDR